MRRSTFFSASSRPAYSTCRHGSRVPARAAAGAKRSRSTPFGKVGEPRPRGVSGEARSISRDVTITAAALGKAMRSSSGISHGFRREPDEPRDLAVVIPVRDGERNPVQARARRGPGSRR